MLFLLPGNTVLRGSLSFPVSLAPGSPHGTIGCAFHQAQGTAPGRLCKPVLLPQADSKTVLTFIPSFLLVTLVAFHLLILIVSFCKYVQLSHETTQIAKIYLERNFQSFQLLPLHLSPA